MAGKGGGAWKVAYADFVTAMMAFFLVMWLVSQKQDAKTAIAQYFKEPDTRSMLPAWAASASATHQFPHHEVDPNSPGKSRKGPQARGKGSGNPGYKPTEDPDGPLANKPRLLRLHQGDRSSVGTIILFPEDSADLNDEAKARLKTVTPLLLGKPNKIEIRGHATRRPLPPDSPFHDPWQLAYARCLATMKFLEDDGVEAARLRLSQAGPFEPQTLRVEPERRARNSCVEVYLLNEFAEEFVGTKEERAERFEGK